jgi:hypothetical protein
MISEQNFNIEFNQDHIRITINMDEPTSFSYNPYIASLVEHMVKEGKQILPLPDIIVKKDIKESSFIFGRTAYYEPHNKKIVLYTMGRHPKDVLRSLAHELVHHHQNLNGELDGLGAGTDTNTDEKLKALEERTYAEGNILFRNWEDNIKKHFE